MSHLPSGGAAQRWRAYPAQLPSRRRRRTKSSFDASAAARRRRRRTAGRSRRERLHGQEASSVLRVAGVEGRTSEIRVGIPTRSGTGEARGDVMRGPPARGRALLIGPPQMPAPTPFADGSRVAETERLVLRQFTASDAAFAAAAAQRTLVHREHRRPWRADARAGGALPARRTDRELSAPWARALSGGAQTFVAADRDVRRAQARRIPRHRSRVRVPPRILVTRICARIRLVGPESVQTHAVCFV